MPSHSTNVRPASAQNPPTIDNNEVARNPETKRAIARIQPEGSFSNAWFHGDSTKENADNLLKASTAGSFMASAAGAFLAWRASETEYILSILTRERVPHHLTIHRPGDFSFQNNLYKSLEEIVSHFSPAVFPIMKTSGVPNETSTNEAALPDGQRNNNSIDNNSNGTKGGSAAIQPVESGNRVPLVRQTHQKKRTQAHKSLVQQAQQTGRFSRIRKFLNNEVNFHPQAAGQVPPNPSGGSTNGHGTENSPVLSLTADPPARTVPAAGGTSVHKLVKGGSQKMIFKIKTTNNVEYRCTSVFGFLEPSGSMDLTIIRLAGAPKENRLVIYFAVAPAKVTDALAAFAAVTPAGTTSNPPPPTTGQVPPTAAHGTTNNQAAENRPMLSLTADPPACTVPAAGGTSVHKLVKGGSQKMTFKIKTTNNVEYRCTQVFGFVWTHLDPRTSPYRWITKGGQEWSSTSQSPQLTPLMLRLRSLLSLQLEPSPSQCLQPHKVNFFGL